MHKGFLTVGSAIALATASSMALAHDEHSEMSVEQHDASAAIAAAIAAPDRPESARNLDESRKPAETLSWLGLEPGMDVADVAAGGGYWTEIMAHVVSPEGTVTAFEPQQFLGGEEGKARWAALMERAPGATLTVYPFEKFSAEPNSFDFAFTNLNYHDLYWESERYQIKRSEPRDAVSALFTAMRPGGLVGVIDHVGPEGDTRAVVEAFHRIAPSTVIADFEEAGFELIGQSDLLANPEDDHTLNVFDPAIRGRTDRFLLKFRKPEN